MILTTESSVSNESHSGSGPPQPFNKSKTENHHKTNGCFFLSGFIGMLTMSDSQSDASRAMHQAVPIRKRRAGVSCWRRWTSIEVRLASSSYRERRSSHSSRSTLPLCASAGCEHGTLWPSSACFVLPAEARARTRQYVRDQRDTAGSFHAGLMEATMTPETTPTEFLDVEGTRFPYRGLGRVGTPLAVPKRLALRACRSRSRARRTK
jgi:hypothetical protein